MLELLFYMILPFVALIYLFYYCSRHEKWILMLLSFLGFVCVWGNRAILFYSVSEGTYPFAYARILQVLLLLPIVPMTHMYVSHLFLDKLLNPRSLGLMLIFCICLPDFVSEIASPTMTYPPADGFANELTISLLGSGSLHVSLPSLALTAQCVWVLRRSYVLWKNIRVQQLVLSRWVRVFFIVLLITAFYIILDSVFSSLYWRSHAMLRVTSCFVSLAITAWFIILPRTSREAAVRDQENNPARIDNDPMTALAFGLQYLMDKERIYTRQGLRVDDVAKMLGTNRSYLSQAIHMVYGCSFPELLSKRRIDEAMELLRNDSSIRVGDVATRCGFSHVSVFGKAFRDATGTSPMEWKKLHGKR